MGIPLGQETRLAMFILGGGDKSRLHEEVAAIVANPMVFLMTRCAGSLPRQQRLTSLSAIIRGKPVSVRGHSRPIEILPVF